MRDRMLRFSFDGFYISFDMATLYGMTSIRKQPPDSPHRATAKEDSVRFRQLSESPEFAEFAHVLKQLTGLSMALNTPDVEATCIGVPGDTGNPVCRLIRSTADGARRCEACDRRQHALAGGKGEPRLYVCHAGFYDIAVPIMIQGEHVATISSGQVLPKQPSDTGFAQLHHRLRWLDISESRLRHAYDKAPWMPRKRLAHVSRLLEIFARHLCDSARRISELEARLERPQIARARAFVNEQYRDPRLQLADAAAHAELSVAHFSHVFHKETGMTFTHYVQSRRVEEAKRLLRDSNRSITETSFACGFNSLPHFNRVFRRGTGCSPSQFRSQQA